MNSLCCYHRDENYSAMLSARHLDIEVHAVVIVWLMMSYFVNAMTSGGY
jgi:hypothetical protein